MHRVLHPPVWLALLALLCLCGGCATRGSRELIAAAKPPAVTLGPVHELLKTPTSRDKVRVVIDRAGLGHVIIATTRGREVFHVTVGPDGVIGRELIRSRCSPWQVDAAFDAAGALHVLIGHEHLIRQPDGSWTGNARTPWAEAGLKPKWARLVSHAGDLMWAFTVDGKAIGAPGRMDWYGIGGGMGAAIIWPWPVHGDKLLIVPETPPPYPAWFAIDPEDRYDIFDWQACADGGNGILLVYDAGRTGLAGRAVQRHAVIALAKAPVPAAPAPPAPAPESRRLNPAIEAVRGLDFGGYGGAPYGSSLALAVDPDGGAALMIKAQEPQASRFWNGAEWSGDIGVPITLFWEPRLAPAGGGAFHGMVVGDRAAAKKGIHHPVLYLRFAGGVWSAPVEIGDAEVDSFWGFIWNTLDCDSRGDGRLLAVWPTPEGISGRWVTAAEPASPQ